MDFETSQRVFGLLSHLLQYPGDDWREELPDVRREAQSIPYSDAVKILSAFLDQAESVDGMEWQDRYVRTFDFGKKTNLYLTYAQHGEERERGPALLELKCRYAEAGFYLESSELPDYLPLVLEFAAAAPWEAARNVLSGTANALQSIRQELAQSGSPYVGLFDLLLLVHDTDATPDPELAVESLATGGVER